MYYFLNTGDINFEALSKFTPSTPAFVNFYLRVSALVRSNNIKTRKMCESKFLCTVTYYTRHIDKTYQCTDSVQAKNRQLNSQQTIFKQIYVVAFR